MTETNQCVLIWRVTFKHRGKEKVTDFAEYENMHDFISRLPQADFIGLEVIPALTRQKTD